MARVNLRKMIEAYCHKAKEEIAAFMIGGGSKASNDAQVSAQQQLMLHGATELSLLDYEFDTEGGRGELPSFYVWTNRSILFLAEFQSNTRGVFSIPRNPIRCVPTRVSADRVLITSTLTLHGGYPLSVCKTVVLK